MEIATRFLGVLEGFLPFHFYFRVATSATERT